MKFRNTALAALAAVSISTVSIAPAVAQTMQLDPAIACAGTTYTISNDQNVKVDFVELPAGLTLASNEPGKAVFNVGAELTPGEHTLKVSALGETITATLVAETPDGGCPNPAPSSVAPAPSTAAPDPSSDAAAPSSDAPAPSSEAPAPAPATTTSESNGNGLLKAAGGVLLLGALAAGSSALSSGGGSSEPADNKAPEAPKGPEAKAPEAPAAPQKGIDPNAPQKGIDPAKGPQKGVDPKAAPKAEKKDRGMLASTGVSYPATLGAIAVLLTIAAGAITVLRRREA